MSANLILSVGMPRAGSGWYYNLAHDLLVAAGYQDARQVRQRYRLQKILTEVNCNIGALTPQRLIPVMIPSLLGNRFAIKAHAGPRPLARMLIKTGLIRVTYIYRDPRDALLSAYEYGQRVHSDNAFSRLSTIDQAIAFMEKYVRISEEWLACEAALHVQYENLLRSYDMEAARLVEFLALEIGNPAVQAVVGKYHPEAGQPGQKGLHLAKRKIGRHRQAFTLEQQELCLRVFGNYLKSTGYPL